MFALPLRNGLDGLMRARGGVLHRLLHFGELPVLVRVAQPSRDRVVFGARADSREAAEWGIERMRLALGIDQDIEPFYERFRFDPLIGRSVRSSPGAAGGRQAGAVRGAGLGDLRAADRVRRARRRSSAG